ncbi:MAG: hypothetical protein PHZ19_03625 [Candidatus Thermoplasmatota archaeon]|nr:hypothetical protein [Candidatus Thermoplasmatota archaeon]
MNHRTIEVIRGRVHCQVCGHLMEQKKLPGDFVCPRCGYDISIDLIEIDVFSDEEEFVFTGTVEKCGREFVLGDDGEFDQGLAAFGEGQIEITFRRKSSKEDDVAE